MENKKRKFKDRYFKALSPTYFGTYALSPDVDKSSNDDPLISVYIQVHCLERLGLLSWLGPGLERAVGHLGDGDSIKSWPNWSKVGGENSSVGVADVDGAAAAADIGCWIGDVI